MRSRVPARAPGTGSQDASAVIPGWEGRDPEAWSRALGLPLLELHRSLSSTNDRLRELGEGGAPFFTAVVADTQVQGRGRGGKRWRSEGGSGLWISVLLPPATGGPAGVTTLAVGVAAAEAVEAVAGTRCRLKWPNDLFLGEGPGAPGFGKLGGILCERVGEVAGTLAGIGINLRPVSTPLAGSVNLETQAGVSVPPPRLAMRLVERLRHWANPPPDHVGPELRRAWEVRDVLEGREVEAEQGGRGTAEGLASDGALLIRLATGRTVAVRAGGVRPIGASWPATGGTGEASGGRG
jgi:BirA family transcriptional regulator, biotin operon repressor / biotin---[acetyl-CoA-carboxylase] ligase